MRVSIIGPAYPYRGGISQFNSLLSKELLSEGYEVDLISFKRMFPNFLYPGKFQKDFDSKIRSNADSLIDSLNPLTWFKVFWRIKRYNPELLIINWWSPFFSIAFSSIAFFVRRFTKIRIVTICHNVFPHERILFDEILTKIYFKKSHVFITHSSEEKKRVESLIMNPIVNVTPLPTYNAFNIKNIGKNEAKKKIGLKDKRIILFFGLIRPSKGLIYLIRAMPEVLRKFDVKLLVVGEFFGDSENKYLEEIKSLGLENNIKMINKYVPDEDVGMYYSACDVAIMPYVSGTSSAVLQTTFGLMKPVICTNVGFSDDIEDNKTGFIVKKESPEALAGAIIKFYLENKEKKFVKNIKKSQDKFSWKNYIGVLEKCVS
ncbi:glycosyltransferase [Candidatus Woesearchaeota archaeon]|nr:glycosyltransferase [Candidatus Woesearchaeota archaeon]